MMAGAHGLEPRTFGFGNRRSGPAELTRHGMDMTTDGTIRRAAAMKWRPVRESNPRLPARQAGTLATELTRRRW